jgi:hypothetical protein
MARQTSQPIHPNKPRLLRGGVNSDNCSLGSSRGVGCNLINSGRSCFGIGSGSADGKPTVFEIMEVMSVAGTDGAMRIGAGVARRGEFQFNAESTCANPSI